jgi:tetratricopeptide (TPR) repeat protein
VSGRCNRTFCASLVSGLLLLGSSEAVDARRRNAAQGTLGSVPGTEALEKAVALVQQGRLEEADQQAQLALRDPDTRAVANSVLGTIRLQQNRLGESTTFLREAIRLEPRLAGAHLSLAEVYTLQQKPASAAGMFRRVLELDPANPTARLALATSEAERGNYQGSLDLAQPALAVFKQSPDGLFVLATDFAKTGNRQAAIALVDDWTRLAGVPQEWSIKFALLLANEGAVTPAIDILERAKQTSPPSYELAFNLGGLHLLGGNPAQALDDYDAALSLQPNSVPALRQAAATAERQNELERSLSYWLRARKLETNDPEILLGFGRVCLKMDLLDDAEPALVTAAGMRPDDATYQYTLAAAKVGKRQFEAAQDLLERLVRKQPQDPQLQYALGSVFYIQGRLTEAGDHLAESVRLQPGQLASRYYLALIARDQGHDAEAIDMLETLIRRYPDHAPSCEALGGLLMAAKRYTDAERNLRKAVAITPKSVKANYQLGLLLARMGKEEEADEQLARAQSLRQEDEATSRLQLRLLEPDR